MTSPPSSIGDTPPYYVLVSQAPLQTTPSAAGPSFKSFGHPTIEYHYADDLPHALLPQSAQEHVLVLDYDPTNVTPPRAQSLSTELAVVGVQVADAPAASSTADDSPNPKKNSKIYVIETTAIPSDSDCIIEEQGHSSAHALLSRFKQRNTILRSVLEYPGIPGQPSQEPVITTNHSFNPQFPPS